MTDSNTSAWGNDDLSGLFGAPGGAGDDLSDLFGSAPAAQEAPSEVVSSDSSASGDDLSDLFGSPEPEAVTTGDDLSDLFGSPSPVEPAAQEPAETAETADLTEPVEEGAPESAERTQDEVAESEPAESVQAESVPAPAPVAAPTSGWRKAPPVLGQATRPAKEVDFGFRAPAAAPAPAPTPALPAAEAPKAQDAPAEEPQQNQAVALAAEPAAAQVAASSQDQGSPVSTSVPIASVPAASVPAVAASAENAASEQEAQIRAAQDFLARAEAAQRASDSNQASERLMAQAKLEQAARRYEDVDRLWGHVTRVMDAVSAESRIVGRLSTFKLTRDALADRDQKREFEDLVNPVLTSNHVTIPNSQDRAFVMQMAYDEVLGISVLGELWRDDAITEIMVDSWDKISVERDGMLLPTRLRFRDANHASSVARSLAQRVSDRAVSKSNPLVSAELPRARVQFCYGAVVRGGLSITLRKFRPLLSFEALLGYGSLSTEMAEFLHDAVLARATILVSGGTGTGKTTIINLLSSFIPDTERVITIEDAFELELSNRNWVAMQTKERSSADDEVNVGLAELLRSTLRMRPDRVIVGEIREASGAEVMITAANTGHDGTMTTIHANSGDLALNDRLSSLLRTGQSTEVEVARQTIASAFHLVVQVSRSKGRRFISEISLVDSTCFNGSRVTPEKVFSAAVSPEGQVQFRRVGSVRPDTELHSKLVEAGVDVTKWENN